ncbi:hypothetical protein GEMRC1_008720 [Eukaryota sp. GEM-RC1]
MRLRIHNLVQCSNQCCTAPYPLKLSVTEVVEKPAPYDKTLVLRLLERMEYSVLVEAAQAVNISIPEVLALDYGENEELCKQYHRLLNEVVVKFGSLTCTSCGRVYPIKETICSFINFTEPEPEVLAEDMEFS